MKSVLARFVAIHRYGHISSNDLDLQHLSHPDYSSIKSITDTLEYYGIANVAVHVPKSSLSQLPQHFLAFFEENQPEAYGLVTRKKGKVHIWVESGGSVNVTEEEFKNVWSGHIVAIESAERRNNTKFDVNVIYALGVFAILALIQWQSFSSVALILTLLAAAGLYFSYLAAKQELGFYSEAAAAVCGAVSSQNSCADVVKSGKGKLLGRLSLSDLSVVYFTSLTLIYSTIGSNPVFNLLLAAASVPVIIFSIYQQALVLKQWCVLCLIIVGIVLAQSATTILTTDLSISFDVIYWLKAVLIGGIVAIAWSVVKSGIKNTKVLTETKKDFLKFKRNPKIFNTLLQEMKANIELSDQYEQLHFGAKDPLVSLMALTNPFCSYCVDSAKSYDTVLRLLKDKVRITFVFNVAPDPANIATIIAARMVDIYREQGEEAAWKAIQAWYEDRKPETWQPVYGKSENVNDHVSKIFASHLTFCKENHLMWTPVTLIDKRVFPTQYSSSDLPLLLDQIIANLKEEEVSK